jgi:hypothetical protein
MKRQFGLVTALALIATFVFGSAGTVGASSSTVVVTPTNTQGWSIADTRPGGSVDFVVDSTAPRGAGALQLTTTASLTAKAQYLHDTNTPLAPVTELSYYTKQVNPPSPPIADPSYQLVTLLNGTSGFTTLVFEPYQNPGNNGNAAIVPNVWQKWNVAAGLFWSTRTVACSNGTVVGTPGGPASYTLTQIEAICPNAVAVGFGVNIGANNPSYNVETDLFDFNGTTYDFEPNTVATNKDQCKDGGYKTFNPPGGPYKNQGQCVSSTNHQGGND